MPVFHMFTTEKNYLFIEQMYGEKKILRHFETSAICL